MLLEPLNLAQGADWVFFPQAIDLEIQCPDSEFFYKKQLKEKILTLGLRLDKPSNEEIQLLRLVQ